MLDLLILHKAEDGTSRRSRSTTSTRTGGRAVGLETQIAEILAAKDVAHLAEAMENGSTAGVLVWENPGRPRSPRRLAAPAVS